MSKFKILEGMMNAIRFAKGEPVKARVTEYKWLYLEFIPQEDITTYELAVIYKYTAGCVDLSHIPCLENDWAGVVDSVKRHFALVGADS